MHEDDENEFHRLFVKIVNFAIKVLNIRILSGFLHIKKGNGDSNISCKFQLYSMQIFFKMAT